ncbi:hypothetical protein AGMMS50267_00270 [Spirochaetia bacterium]|nr:hypothetical protein AGMMS50267_00270 [Spirochaetia bacterium]
MKRILALVVIGLLISPLFGAQSSTDVTDTLSLQNDLRIIRAEIDAFKVMIADLIDLSQKKRAELAQLNSEIERAKNDLAQVKGELDAAVLAKANQSKSETFVITDFEIGAIEMADLYVPTVAKEEVFVLTAADIDYSSTVMVAAAVPTASEPSSIVLPALTAAPAVAASEPSSIVLPALTAAPAVYEVPIEKELPKTIFFDPDSTRLVDCYIPTIIEVANELVANPTLTVTIRGYSAPAKTVRGQIAVSKERAMSAANYILSEYGIDSERLIVEWVGASEKPAIVLEKKSDCLRAVEFIVGGK